MENPIIALYRSTEFDGVRHQPAVMLFDRANGEAWNRAGSPDDTPGSEWAAWENEALSYIEADQEPSYSSAWELIDALLSEWGSFDGDVSYFYEKWSNRIYAL